MENASKALIIAGAILLSILIISLGLMVYNQAKDTVGSVNLTQQEIEAFNAKFTSYEGEKVSGSKVNALIQTVMASNQQAINDSTGAYVAINFPSMTNDKYVFMGVGDNGASEYIGYLVDAKYMGASDVVTIQEKAADPGHSLTLSAAPSAEGKTYSLKVTTGEEYSVKFAYESGRVAGIFVE